MLNTKTLPANLLDALHKRGHADEQIAEMTPAEAFDEFCNWHGLSGWGGELWSLMGKLQNEVTPEMTKMSTTGMNTSQIDRMLCLQDSMNAKVNPSWQTAGYPFLRAAVLEAAEAIEHHGWKWWKAQQKDLPQLQMELVDIWHFALSHYVLEAKGDFARANQLIAEQLIACDQVAFDGRSFILAEMGMLEKLELLLAMCDMRKFPIKLFESIMADADMDWNVMYREYISKNVLNFFRQDHGYKDGSYVKVWAGREDNEHLVEIAASLDAGSSDFSDQLYAGLKERYQSAALALQA